MYTVTGLVSDAEYQFRIIAQNDVGLSESSPVSEPVICKDPFGKERISEVVISEGASHLWSISFISAVQLIPFSIVF